ncbi:MAG: hypothetical protein AVDCRST_MAG28-2921 [uncultured Rubrobacteraceae bacterium]|uniref:GGDEF domain-containing protein n=1 Tax=uncultured Rubrobacteraceae bacterium TaxID=349277 RepID=A0A6J4R1N0_9ACTN|nr:MAG: hypothetical protein AVDCRST_MAG28-2921 [uncultured Rubrobacteraceae bacterium]
MFSKRGTHRRNVVGYTGSRGQEEDQKELQTVETFEKALREEVSVSNEFDLPLTVLALGKEGGWEEGDIRRALDALRTADLIAHTDEEIVIVLPNTITDQARIVEERLRARIPEAAFGVVAFRQGDDAEDLLKRARNAIPRTKENPETA